MDQNEEIFIRYMNDEPFHRTVSRWMATEAYGGCGRQGRVRWPGLKPGRRIGRDRLGASLQPMSSAR